MALSQSSAVRASADQAEFLVGFVLTGFDEGAQKPRHGASPRLARGPCLVFTARPHIPPLCLPGAEMCQEVSREQIPVHWFYLKLFGQVVATLREHRCE
jgi:hypothetical protein